MWRYREAHAEAINRLGPPHKLDVTLAAEHLPEFFARVRPAVAAVAPDARVWLFGHAGDGNVHVNVTGVAPDDERVTDAVLRLVAGLHGSISAEHGIGTAKRRWVHLTRSPAELRALPRDQRRARPERHPQPARAAAGALTGPRERLRPGTRAGTTSARFRPCAGSAPGSWPRCRSR